MYSEFHIVLYPFVKLRFFISQFVKPLTVVQVHKAEQVEIAHNLF